jgi:hypothetical protein
VFAKACKLGLEGIVSKREGEFLIWAAASLSLARPAWTAAGPLQGSAGSTGACRRITSLSWTERGHLRPS